MAYKSMTTDNVSTEETSFVNLTPDTMLDAIEAEGILCDGRFLALNSYENRVYQIGVEDGDALVAKFYRPHRWTDEAILEEHQFTLDLAEQEIPVIPPIVDKHGKSLHKQGSFRFALYLNRGGRALELDNVEQLEQLGRFIGRIHALGATKDFQHRPTLDIKSFGEIPRAYLLDNKFIPDYLRESYETLTHDLLNQIRQIFETTGNVKNIRLHGDCHPSNILYRDQIPHIVDFDDARTGPAIQDLWMFLSGDRAYSQARLGDLLVGYEQFYEFDPRELNLIEALRSLRMLHYAYWLASRWNDSAFPQAFPWFNTINYWEDHVLSLREQAAAMNEPALIW
jgi:Ser/Thr protein kinase RdoA (MazF antagonist)